MSDYTLDARNFMISATRANITVMSTIVSSSCLDILDKMRDDSLESKQGVNTCFPFNLFRLKCRNDNR